MLQCWYDEDIIFLTYIIICACLSMQVKACPHDCNQLWPWRPLHLNVQMVQTSFSEIKLVVAQILQQKMQQLTLIEANLFYVFDYIDPPAVMEKRIAPSRSFICFIGAFLGGILGSLVVVIRYYFMDKKILESL